MSLSASPSASASASFSPGGVDLGVCYSCGDSAGGGGGSGVETCGIEEWIPFGRGDSGRADTVSGWGSCRCSCRLGRCRLGVGCCGGLKRMKLLPPLVVVGGSGMDGVGVVANRVCRYNGKAC